MLTLIDKTVCQFLFLHDLSAWHYSARRPFKDYWVKIPFKLTAKEKQALRAWQRLNKKFYKEKGDFILSQYLVGKLNKQTKNEMFEIFKVFEPRFLFHFQRQLPSMKKVARYLTSFNRLGWLRTTFKLYGLKMKVMPVYVAMSYNANKSAGGMQLGNAVILQFGDYKLQKDNSPLLNVLFHELTHKGSIQKYLPENLNIKLPPAFTGNVGDYINEIVHKALWSEIGLFSQKQFRWTAKEIENKKKFLLKNFKNPYKQMIQQTFKIREYLVRELEHDHNFKFNKNTTQAMLEVLK